MKNFIFIIAVMAAGCGSNQKPAEAIAKIAEVKNNTVAFPYQINYSSSFEIDDPQNIKVILDIIKNWDDNTLDNALPYLNDTLYLNFGKGEKWNGPKDSIWNKVKALRSQYGSMETKVDAAIAFQTTDKKDHWVATWTRQYFTDKTGKKDSADLCEGWTIDPNTKKAIFLSRYYAVLAP